jgi:hypothetical protein
VAADQPSYPVLIFLEGIKFGYRQQNTFQVEELVSHGYIVAAIDQPYAAATVMFPDGRRAAYDPRMDPPHSAFMDAHIPYLAHDALFTLDQLTVLNRADPNGSLTGRLDLQRAGLFGMSLGAIVGGEACRLEPRLRAGLLEDAFMPADVVRAGLRQPTMWITRDADTMRLERRRSGGWSEADIQETLTTMRAVFQSLPGDGYYVQVPGMFHADMTDVPLLSPLASRLGLSGPIGAPRAHQIINAYCLAFFDRHLKTGRRHCSTARPHSIPRCSSKPDLDPPTTSTVFRTPRLSAAGLIDWSSLRHPHDRQNRACPTSSPVSSPNHHQPHKPALCRGPGLAARPAPPIPTGRCRSCRATGQFRAVVVGQGSSANSQLRG